ncbi:MAG: hypothetical protein B6245_01410 [Desulfobacteraceae bacterium 4572_88]|nr:MAG: hypothetical protein B6245_01410 [Desulfobacteraceae bacterium 4572_88]
MKHDFQPSVLIIDDHTKNLQILADMLQEKEYNVAMAKNGCRALKFISRRKPDMILLDIMMPDMDGFEVCRQLKAQEETKNIPIIFISALTDMSNKIKGFQTGGVDYITKPFRKEEVFARVTTHLELNRSYEKLREMNDKLRLEIRERRRIEASLRKANKEITDGMRYAEMIQRSLLPDDDEIRNRLPDSFFIWMPKSIVGGDIIFADTVGKKLILAVIDCAGHGVPGAFLTMIASAALRRIIKDEGQHSPANILNRLNVIVKTTLRQDTEHALSDEGLEAAVISVRIPDTEHQANTDDHVGKLIFAGARLPLFCVHHDEIKNIDGNRERIGYKKSDMGFNFTEHTVNIEKGMCFYVATDGFKDQIGGHEDKDSRFGFIRFGKERFANLLREVSVFPFDRQKEILTETFHKYRGDRERQDDVTILGFGFCQGSRIKQLSHMNRG